MRRALPLLLLLPALAAFSAERRAPQCPDGRVPDFTGHPFKPFACPKPGEAAPSAPLALPDGSLPSPKARDKTHLKPFVGRWGGLVVVGMSRYEVLVEVKRKGGDYHVRGWVKDYHLHTRHELAGLLDAVFFKPGRFSAALESPTLPGAKLQGEAWLGAAAGAEGGAPFDRELVWRFRERPSEVHRLLLGADGPDALRFAYTALGPGGPLGRAGGRLARTARESL